MAVDRVGAQSIRPSVGSVNAIQGHDVRVNNSTINVVGGDQHHTHIHYHAITDKLKAILDAVSNYRKIQQDTLAKATAGTILWLFKCKEFRLFVDIDGTLKILWGSGMPGAGKTILASIVIKELERLARESNGQICVAYVYIRYSDQNQVNIRGILESLVKQTIERHPDCVALAQQVYDAHIREGTRPSEDELLQLLGEFTQRKTVTFYVLDALDEAYPGIRLKLIRKLLSLGARLFITSRPLPALQEEFPGVHAFPIVAQDEDLELHINEKVSDSEHLCALLKTGDSELKERLVSMVKEKSGGMFLHASLQLDALQDCFTLHALTQTLEAFPRNIEDMYQRTWDRIIHSDQHQASLVTTALAWVLNAKQSMTIDQLQRALATCPETYHFEPARLPSEAILLAASRGLIIVDRGSQLARLVHYTAKEPLERLLSSVLPNPHSLLTAVCITRLADSGFQNTTITLDEELYQAVKADALLDYAYAAWALHARYSIHFDQTASLVSTFVAGCRAFPVQLGGFPMSSKLYFSNMENFAPLHITALYNLPITIAGPQATHNPNIAIGRFRLTPLHLASLIGNQAVVQNLLCLPGIVVNPKDDDGRTPMMMACHQGHEGIVALFLARPDIEVNVRDNTESTPLMFSSGYGLPSMVKLLLTHPNINVDLAGLGWRSGTTALILASENGRTSTVEILLTVPGINVNAVDKRGDTAIKLAAERGHEDIVQMLLDVPRIDISSKGSGLNNLKTGFKLHTAVSAAVQNGHHGIVRLLQDFEAERART